MVAARALSTCLSCATASVSSAGWVSANRVTDPGIASVEYSLTSLGSSLLSAIEPLAAWSAEQRTEIRRHQDAYDMSAEVL